MYIDFFFVIFFVVVVEWIVLGDFGSMSTYFL